jgi:hypothetical protein
MKEHCSRPSLVTIVFGLLAMGVVLADGGPEHRVRTMSFGSSGGNVNYISSAFCCSGTLGALVAASDGTRYVLSNNHVLGLSGQAQSGDDVSQPGLADTGCVPGDVVADFSAAPALRDNVDAAVAELRPGPNTMDASGHILDIGVPSSVVSAPSVNLAVAKSGRTTGLTTASISVINATVKVRYQESCGEGRRFMVRFTNQIMIDGSGFSAGGDSGSLIVTSDTHQPVGLLFAGSSTTTVANPIGEVLNRVSAALGRSLSFLSSALSSTSTQISSLPDEEVARGTLAKEAHGRRLLDDPGVVGVGVGEEIEGSGRPAVIVYVAASRGRAGIPRRLDNIAVRVVETEPIVAFGWNEAPGQTCAAR